MEFTQCRGVSGRHDRNNCNIMPSRIRVDKVYLSPREKGWDCVCVCVWVSGAGGENRRERVENDAERYRGGGDIYVYTCTWPT